MKEDLDPELELLAQQIEHGEDLTKRLRRVYARYPNIRVIKLASVQGVFTIHVRQVRGKKQKRLFTLGIDFFRSPIYQLDMAPGLFKRGACS